ncbi:potassium/sodium hyperpolarization-activated cyclic nucleotide-gated channel 1 [Histomonas meleagridis]|uniref:potassium/sodium hyperpolarization-activated cyclic nucleotide-gated channel 1 n=1 Tax=Histomonas meleagridis TaxID=135588 RepID=UPI00355AC86C|nr:potassium/sodium hyperpolarization-activated cyclic nucleotide-gated channel 1 [Histomonas meleagridis]KAH0805407.1 potassium/sodium hyperpolarization-activated cyclic nucleotide-gated channel 1 [Histomonas meleagridis]
MENLQEKKEPSHWELLSPDDQHVYQQIYKVISAPTNRNKRNKKVDDFKDIIDAIELFENSDEEGKWKRCLVCGICKVSNGIAINISQFKKLILKCKSSINGSLKSLGYTKLLSKPSLCPELLEIIPYLKSNPNELRQWTVRMKLDSKVGEEDRLMEISPPQVEDNFDLFNTNELRVSNIQIGTDSLSNWDGFPTKDLYDFSFEFF